ncbi:MAG: hypothetical protein E7353_05765 [Clostridiales bacterium]|nr:hypothetical protein [Clostridiales bacterium]
MIENELKKRNLPDLFYIDGKQIKTKEEWEKIGKEYWRNIIQKEGYGFYPPIVKPEICTKINRVDFAGKATWEEVYFTFNVDGKTHTVPTNLIYPKNKKNIPFFIYVNFRPDIPDRLLPVEEIIDNGFGIFSVCHNDISTDNGDFTNGLAGLFQEGERKECDCGKIVYWSYMASRMMDYLQTLEQVDKTRIGISGHSRLGKTALLTAAFDERFAFTCPNNSGCSGVALSRGCCEKGEKVADICKTFPYWFCTNYHKYADNEQSLPFDQHCLVALVAPRLVYVGGALEDVWADNDSQFLSCVEASKVWKMYGKDGLICPDRLPVCGDVFTEGEVGFHLRAGTHYQSREDWNVYMSALKKKL